MLVVEHDRTLIEGADHLIDLGPGAGEHGGEIVAQGTPQEVVNNQAVVEAYLGRGSTLPQDDAERGASHA